MTPHPPILVPEIGGDNLAFVGATIAALESISKYAEANAIDTLIIMSPHAPVLSGSFALRAEPVLTGSFKRFGLAEPIFSINCDQDAVEKIVDGCRHRDIPTAARTTVETSADGLDWGFLVPYWFFGGGRAAVALSISDLPYTAHFSFGRTVARALAGLRRKYLFVASGDLSHRLTAQAPYGFSSRAGEFDQLVTEALAAGRESDLLSIDPDLISEAGECGLRSFITLAGFLSEFEHHHNLLSYEGPFGVGYAVGLFAAKGAIHAV